jgi:hypothetical protein
MWRVIWIFCNYKWSFIYYIQDEPTIHVGGRTAPSVQVHENPGLPEGSFFRPAKTWFINQDLAVDILFILSQK